MKKVVRYNEQALERIVRKIVKESNTYDGAMERLHGDKPQEKREENYMFFQNLREIQSAVEELLSMDKNELDRTLTNGHDWASEHITTAKDDIEEVLSFFKHRTIEEGVINEGWKDAVVGGMMALATMLPKVADAQDGRVDWETVKDTVEYVSKDLDRDTIRRISTVMSKTFKDTGGNVDKMVQKIKWEYTKPNSWEVDPSKTEKEKIKKFEKVDPVTQKRVRLTNRDGKKTIYFDGKYRPSPEDVKEMYYDTGEITKKEYDNYVEKYNRWLSLFKKR